MIYIILSGITAGAFSLGYKIAGNRHYPTLPLLTVYSLMTAISTFVVGRIAGNFILDKTTVFLGAVLGLSTLIAIFLYFYVTKHARHNISWTVIQFSVLVPLLFSIFVYGERPTPGALAGTGCILGAVVFLGIARGRQGGLIAPEGKPAPLKVGLVLTVSTILSGLAQTVAPAYIRRAPGGEILPLMFISGVAMTLLCLVLMCIPRRVNERNRVLPKGKIMGLSFVGAYMAIFGVAAFGLLLMGLRIVPATAGFPARNAVNILTVFILTFFIFKERASRLELVGVAVAVAGIALVSSA